MSAEASDDQPARRRHVWPHFASTNDVRFPCITAGKGCYLYDQNGHEYIDALAGLFAVQIGYGFGEEIAAAATEQLTRLPFYTNWGFTHPPSEELAKRLVDLAPDQIEQVFFVSGGSEAVESAWKLARQYHRIRGENRWKVIARRNAYHGTSLGALSITGIPSIKNPFEPLLPGTSHVNNTSRYRRAAEESESAFTQYLLDELEAEIVHQGPETVAMVIMEPVQASGGALVPPRGYLRGVREICNRYGVLFCADEVICAFGRLGAWFGSEKYGVKADLITIAKGLSSAYATMGAVLISAKVADEFVEHHTPYMHGYTFGGHPVAASIALRNLEIMEREDVLGNVNKNTSEFERAMQRLYEYPVVGDVRGSDYFWAVELVDDRSTKAPLSGERKQLMQSKLLPALFENGVICRVDDRALPMLIVSPPLIADRNELNSISDRIAKSIKSVYG